MAIKMDGKKCAAEFKDKIAHWIKRECGRTPKLLIVTVGEDDASKVYVRNKMRAAEEVGIDACQWQVSREEYENDLFWCNFIGRVMCVDGVILQLPVPKWCDAAEFLTRIPEEKDVDGLTYCQVGKLHLGMDDALLPCTPAGICALIQSYMPSTALCGKNALVIGRSDLVGRPIAELLLQMDMNVTICHSKTPKDVLLDAFARADLVVSAVGRPNLITEWDAMQYFKDNRHYPIADFRFKSNRIIIDVGINRDENGKLCGDLPEDFKEKYSEWYTPVPGGVGPMTVAMLMLNTYIAATRTA